MKQGTRITAALVALPLLGGMAGGTAWASDTSGCPSTTIFEVDGGAHGDGSNFAPFNATVPPDVRTQVIVYSGAIAPIYGTQTLDDAVADAQHKLDIAVHTSYSQCPGTHISIAGYSEGAIPAGNELNQLAAATDIPHDLVNGVLYADARRPGVPGAGLDGGAGGVMTNIPTFLPGATMQGPRGGFGDIPVREICHQNDGVCNSENPINNLLAFANGLAGYLDGDHGYPLNPIADAGNGLEFIQQQPRVPYGPPLPIPSPTPWQLFNGDAGLSQTFVHDLLTTLRTTQPVLWQQIVTQEPWVANL